MPSSFESSKASGLCWPCLSRACRDRYSTFADGHPLHQPLGPFSAFQTHLVYTSPSQDYSISHIYREYRFSNCVIRQDISFCQVIYPIGLIEMPCHLLDLPREIVEQILCYLPPTDLRAFGKTCHAANSIVAPSNQMLWRHAFLHEFDDPHHAWSELLPSARSANAALEAEWDWYLKLHERLKALQTISTKNKTTRALSPEETTNVLVEVLETAHGNHPIPGKTTGLSELFETQSRDPHPSLNIQVLESTFRDNPHAQKSIHDFDIDITQLSGPSEILHSGPIGRPFTRSMVAAYVPVSENASRLHVYFGLTRNERFSSKAQGATRQLVYDWSRTGEDTDYGPFIRDGSGRVNWALFEAVCSLIGRHFELLTEETTLGRLGIPQKLRYNIPYQMKFDQSQPEDWARVTGSWLGTYAFLDYSILHRFNVGYFAGARPALESCDEARGDLMQLQLRLDDKYRDDWRLRTNMPVCEDLPVLYFSGTSMGAGASRPYILVRGRVSLIPGARQVRWRFIIRYVES